ncbi:MAG: tRNA threonylcarbamoyladenosine dehydratase [Ruminococcaceae bacterium]|nr:tRNA threonylcarbamoyladenosine dehydratase [Oscillospiraceae bacterium]
MEQFSRTERLIGKENLEKIKNKNIIIFGLGGVGSYVAEALARCGIGKMTVVDKDTVDITNINRQLYALHSTIGRNKADVARERILDINPECQVTSIVKMYLPENADEFNLAQYDYIIDAIDNVTAKIDLAIKSQELGIPMIASMGTGNKLDPTAFKITDIYKTDTCPLCRVMRRELKARGVEKLKVLYSTEIPKNDGERTPASISFVPSVAGLIIAGEVIKEMLNS